MKLHFKEEPKEWRKVALLGLVGPSVLAAILRWRGLISWHSLATVLILFFSVALCVSVQPRWFRGYYRFATWIGFRTTQITGHVVLIAFFFLILTPFSWGLRLMGKDLLQLKAPGDQKTFWRPAKQKESLDRMY